MSRLLAQNMSTITHLTMYIRGSFLNYATYATQGSCIKFYATHVTYVTQHKTLRKNYASNATQLESWTHVLISRKQRKVWPITWRHFIW